MPRGTKRLVAALIAVAIAVTLFATTTGFDYGNVRWGMTVEEVIRATGAKYDGDRSNEPFIFYSRTCAKPFATSEAFMFYEGKLVLIHATLPESKSVNDAYNHLHAIFGAPIRTNVIAGRDVAHIEFSNGRTDSSIFLDHGIAKAINFSMRKK